VVTHFHTVNVDHTPASRWSTAIVAVSKYVKSHADTQGIPTTVIHNSVDETRFNSGKNLRGEFDIRPDDIVVSFVGQIRQIKGLDDFVAMAKRITGKNIHFLIAGQCRAKSVMPDAYSREELMALIATDSRIRYCGYLDQIEDLYRTSNIVVAPSRWQEPFGLVCIETGAAGLPLVTTRVGGIPEIIEDGVNGMMVDPGDVTALTDKVQQLIDDPTLRATLGKNARIHVERDFTEKPVRALEAFYDTLLA
jgi:glycosyltransferase involved in cell wall biosynthesis